MTALDNQPGAASAAHIAPASFEQVYHEHSSFVWRNAQRLGVADSNVEDVLQDVFIVVQRRLADFDRRGAMRPWIFGILLNVVRHYRRSFRRKDARCVPLEQEVPQSLAEEPGAVSPCDRAEHAERVRLLENLLAQLDESKRTLLVLSELEGWTLREIAEHLGSNTNTVHSRLRSAKRAFDELYRSWLAQQGDAP